MAKPSLQHDRAICYVYEIVVDAVVRYVGKGTRYRHAHHLAMARKLNAARARGERVRALKVHNRLAKALRLGLEVEVRKVSVGLTARSALAQEIALIAAAPEGQLWNMTAGGEGVDSETARRTWAKPKFRIKMIAIRRSPEFRKNAREKSNRHFADPQQRQKSRDRTLKLWRDPEFASRTVKAVRLGTAKPESRAKVSRAAKRRFANPIEREKRAVITKGYMTTHASRERSRKISQKNWSDPIIKKKMTAHWDDPERKRRIVEGWTPEFLAARGRAISAGLAKSAKHRAHMANPERAKRVADAVKSYWSRPEARARQSLKMKALWLNPEHRQKTTAHWKEKRQRNDKSEGSGSVRSRLTPKIQTGLVP